MEDGRKVLYVDVLPEKSCIYNCIFCIRPKCHMGPSWDFGDVEDSLQAMRKEIEKTKPDMVYLFGQGDPITNDKFDRIVDCVHEYNLPVRTIVNGAMLGEEYHMREANMCEEVVGCLCTVTEETFQKLHRPIPELSCAKKIDSLIKFSHQYQGKFILRVVMIKGFNDSDEHVAILKSIVDQIRFDELSVGTRPTGKAGNKYAVSDERLEEIRRIFLS